MMCSVSVDKCHMVIVLAEVYDFNMSYFHSFIL